MAEISFTNLDMREGLSLTDYTAQGAPDFSLDTYREVNKVRLYFHNQDVGKVVKVFEAYFKGEVTQELGINYGTYADSFIGKINKWTGPLTRSVVQSLTGDSGSVDSKINPYIDSTEPLKFDIPCYLNIVNPLTGVIDYQNNIRIPINSLQRIVLPNRDVEGYEKIKNDIVSTLKGGVDWIFRYSEDDKKLSDAEKQNVQNLSFWGKLNKASKDLIDNFLTETYILRNPEQFKLKRSLILRVGKFRFADVMVNKMNVKYSPLIYADAQDNLYPAYANVTLSIQTRTKATIEDLDINSNNIYPELRALLK